MDLRAGRTPAAPPVPRLVGREREKRLLGDLVEAVEGGGAAGVLLGEPGIGKTTLLEHVAGTCTPRVHWVRAAESEESLPYAAANDLLHPFLDHLDGLPPAQREALEVALARVDHPSTPAAGPLAVCTGALALLAAAGE